MAEMTLTTYQPHVTAVDLEIKSKIKPSAGTLSGLHINYRDPMYHCLFPVIYGWDKLTFLSCPKKSLGLKWDLFSLKNQAVQGIQRGSRPAKIFIYYGPTKKEYDLF
ncbi:hypothetical protein M9H77_03862 [Catharanthus roseus]|uniref:Uncharacterized protein n=1 Tax=Catharanthus roseus TaxID=4058 RepID=A0ACC0CCW6_CATRO|nr:hypothetical protein M9H77_03862 [Catharanthus roseus]